MKADKKILTYRQLAAKIPKIRKGKKIAVATGTFDLLHAGHVLFLEFAKSKGDILVVGLGSDRTVKMYKGDTRPIVPERARAQMLAALETVDYVVCMDEDPIDKIGGRNFFKIVKPDVWVVPDRDHNPEGVKKFAKELNTKLIINRRTPPKGIHFPISTSYIIDKIRKTKNN